MSYFRASTANTNGWRPGTVQGLGYMSSSRQNGPDWKTVAAQHQAATRAHQHHQRQRQRANAHRMAVVDAAARGDRTRVRMPRMLSGLGGLGMLSNSAQMVQGAQYVFHFTGPNTTVAAFSGSLRNQIAADTNFQNPVVTAEPSGMRVTFIYQGQGSTIGDAGAEMQNVLRSQTFFSNGFMFSGAEGGPQIVPGSQGSQVFIGPDGILRDANGNVISANTSNPGDQSNNNNGGGSTFDWSSFWEGMGLSAGVGTALAVGLGILILKN